MDNRTKTQEDERKIKLANNVLRLLDIGDCKDRIDYYILLRDIAVECELGDINSHGEWGRKYGN